MAPQNSVWLWVLCACIIMVSIWVPLAMLALLVGGKIGQWLTGHYTVSSLGSPVLLAPAAVLVLLSFGLACGVGGAVLGRFSDRSRKADAALAAGAAIAIVLVFAALGHALPSAAFCLAVGTCMLILGPAPAIVGHGWGRRRRAAAPVASE